MNNKYALGSIFTILLANPAYSAINCATLPSCASLGFKQTPYECSGRPMLKCPFDTSKVYCGCKPDQKGINGICYTMLPSNGYDCDTMGYIYDTSVVESCKAYIECTTPQYFKEPNGRILECYPRECSVSSSCSSLFGYIDTQNPIFKTIPDIVLAQSIEKNIGIFNISDDECREKFVLASPADSDDFIIYRG